MLVYLYAKRPTRISMATHISVAGCFVRHNRKATRKYGMKTEALMTYFSLFCMVSKAQIKKPVKALNYLLYI